MDASVIIIIAVIAAIIWFGLKRTKSKKSDKNQGGGSGTGSGGGSGAGARPDGNEVLYTDEVIHDDSELRNPKPGDLKDFR